MDKWGGGYVTDIPYMEGFYSSQSPQHLALAAVLNGFQAPNLNSGFAYCELGCGRGLTSLMFAAANPEAEFHAIDFQPAHIAHARERAGAAELRNITFHERSFEDLLSPGAPDLPMFDVVTMHGVWSWIAPSLQVAITEFLNRKLKPGGLVYVSYNTMPAWLPMQPLQRVLKELSALSPGRSDQAIDHAIAMLKRLTEANIIPPILHGGVKRITNSPASLVGPYLAHEYLNDYWRPVYHIDVVRALSAAKLSFAASTELLKNFTNLCVTEAQQKVLAEIPTPELRETLKDYCVNDWLRQDVFVRGARRMSEAERNAQLEAMTLVLQRPAPEVVDIHRPDGSVWRPSPEAYAKFIAALETRPHSVRELLSLPGLPIAHGVRPVELVGVLIGTGLAAPFQQPSTEAQQACDRLNRTIETASAFSSPQGVTVALASLKGGMTLGAGEFNLYMTARQGGQLNSDQLAARYVALCKHNGGHPIIDDKTVEDEAEAHAAAARDYAVKIQRLIPLWHLIGMI